MSSRCGTICSTQIPTLSNGKTFVRSRFKGHAGRRACRRNQIPSKAAGADAEIADGEEGDRTDDSVRVADTGSNARAVIAGDPGEF